MARSNQHEYGEGISRSRNVRRQRRAREASRDLDHGMQYVMANHHLAHRFVASVAPKNGRP